MKNYIKIFLLFLALGFSPGVNAQTHTIHSLSDSNQHVTYRDMIEVDGGASRILVGQVADDINMAGNSSAIIVNVDGSNNIIWQKRVEPPVNSNNSFTKVIEANDGNHVIAIGFYGTPPNFGNGYAFLAVYSLGGTLVSNQIYRLNGVGGGEIFFDVVQDPFTDDIYVCGGTDFAPEFAQSMVASLAYPSGNINWWNQYVVGNDGGNCSDAFTTLDYYTGSRTLHVFGYMDDECATANALQDVTHVELDPSSGAIIAEDMMDVISQDGFHCNTPSELFIDQGTGDFLLAGTIVNDYGASTRVEHFVMAGDVTTSGTMNVSQINEYRNTDGFNFENNIVIEPIDIPAGDFIIIQSPGSQSNGNPTNISVSTVMESNISFVSNFTTINWTRQLGVDGQQWFVGSALTNGGSTIELAGSSINNPNQTHRDAYYFVSDVNIPEVSSGCEIIKDSVFAVSINSTPFVNPFDTIQIDPEHTNVLDVDLELKQLNLCSTPCTDSLTTIIDSNLIITSDTFFTGRYYIAANVIITVKAGAILDLTNVDLIFDNCAGIDVFGRIRANNSVFRTCDESDTWRGIWFYQESDESQINECLFKNAEAALYFDMSNNPKINSNTFKNCSWSIYTSEASFKHPIANNNFIYDEDFTSLSFCNAIGVSDVSAMFFDRNSSIHTEIKGNRFLNYGTAVNGYYGIVSLTSFVREVSGNYFTGMGKAVYYTQLTGLPELIKINNNEMERQISRDGATGSQIHIEDCMTPMEIESNVIKANVPVEEYAIELFQSHTVNVHENEIEGFLVGVVANMTSDCGIINNHIMEPEEIGIALESAVNTEVKCNVIEMNHQITGIFHNQSNESFIESNCIFDSKYALVFGSGSNNSTVLNNYMYNYTGAGVYNGGELNLNIGLNPVHGQNTFWSNSAATDVITAGGFTTNCYNNFGIGSISANTVITGPASVNSTTSCGHQIYNLSGAPQGIIYDCRPANVHEEIIDDKDILDILTTVVEPLKPAEGYFNGLFQHDPGAANQLFDAIVKADILKANDLLWFKINRYKAERNATEWLRVLESITPRDEDEQALVVLSHLEALEVQGKLNLSDLNETELNMLRGVYDPESIRQNVIGLVLIKNRVKGNIVSTKLQPVQVEPANRNLINKVANSTLKLYPNPTGDQLTVQFSFMEEEHVHIGVYNTLGQEVYSFDTDTYAGELNVDVQNLTSGTYVVKMIQGGHIEAQTFVKQ